MAVEGVPGPDLVLVQVGLPLSLLQAFLNPPLLMPVKLQSSPAEGPDLGRC